MVDFKDIAGLSEPVKRLIEVVAEGIGAVSRSLLTRRNADAKAYEIRTIAQAIADSQKFPGTINYEAGGIIIESSSNQERPIVPEADTGQRVVARIAYQEAKKQSNIEHITRQAAEELRSEREIASQKPDSDWITRFFRIAEDITTDDMQILWGKILAGEVKRPGSYSLRTLELLKNIDQREAGLFVKAAKIAIVSDNDKAFIPQMGTYIQEKFGLTFTDFLLLREIDLLVPNDLELSLKPAEDNTQSVFACGSTCVVVDRAKDTPKHALKCIAFTEIGKQLLQLVEKAPADSEYIQKFAALFRQDGVVIKSGLIIEWQNNSLRHTDLQEVPVETPKGQK